MTTRDRILVVAAPSELRPDSQGAVDVYAALERQFFWADAVIVGRDDAGLADDELEAVLAREVLDVFLRAKSGTGSPRSITASKVSSLLFQLASTGSETAS